MIRMADVSGDSPTADASNPRAWLARAVAGDELALNQLLLHHHDHLVNELRPLIPESARALISPDDVAQDAYVAVFQRIASFEPRGDSAFFGWLLTIAQNRLTDMLRALRADKRGGGRVVAADDLGGDAEMSGLLELLARHSRTPSRVAAADEAAESVRQALRRIPPDYQDALRLRYVEGLPVAAIARQLDRTEGAVHMLCNRGLRALREAIGDPSQIISRIQ